MTPQNSNASSSQPGTHLRKKLLWIKADPLHPLNTGGKIRTFSILAELRKHYEVVFFTLHPLGTPPIKNCDQYSHHLKLVNWKDVKSFRPLFFMELMINYLFSKVPYVIDRYTNAQIRKALDDTLRQDSYDMVICDFLSLSKNLVSLDRIPGTTYLLFQHNVESKIWERHMQNAANPLSAHYFNSQWRRFKKYEKKTCGWFDGVITVSKNDTRVFREEFGLTNIIGDVSTGVDVAYFAEINYQPQKNVLAFMGSMDWLPNIDGIVDFVDKTYPLIKKKRPNARLLIIGRNPSKKVRRLARMDSSITVTGTVDDIRPLLAKAEVAVVPLRIGGGTRIKIFEIMAAGLPVVSTTIGAEGLPVRDGHEILIADDPLAFARCVTSLLEDRAQAEKIARHGFDLVSENYSWQKVAGEFVDILSNSGSGKAGG